SAQSVRRACQGRLSRKGASLSPPSGDRARSGNDRQSSRNRTLSSGPPGIRTHVPRQTSVHQKVANRIADRQRTDRNSNLEESSAQSGSAALHRLRSQSHQTAWASRLISPCWRPTESASGTSATSRDDASCPLPGGEAVVSRTSAEIRV